MPRRAIRWSRRRPSHRGFSLALALTCAALCAQTPLRPQAPAQPTQADILRGGYGPYRANNDLLYYHLDVRVDPEKKFLSGKNTIRFKMLRDGTRIQLDLTAALHIDKILFDTTPLQYKRDSGAVFVDFPETLRAGQVYSIDFYYSGHPEEEGRFGGFAFRKDSSGRPWINTACEGIGASTAPAQASSEGTQARAEPAAGKSAASRGRPDGGCGSAATAGPAPRSRPVNGCEKAAARERTAKVFIRDFNCSYIHLCAAYLTTFLPPPPYRCVRRRAALAPRKSPAVGGPARTWRRRRTGGSC